MLHSPETEVDWYQRAALEAAEFVPVKAKNGKYVIVKWILVGQEDCEDNGRPSVLNLFRFAQLYPSGPQDSYVKIKSLDLPSLKVWAAENLVGSWDYDWDSK